ncbi:MAG: ferredoxin--NADP reductase, partial [Bacteroidota bacterium]
PIEDKVVRRSYSICTAPNLDSTVAVSVKRVEGGLVSNYLNDNVNQGQKIEIMEPMGNFTLSVDKSAERHHIMLGGGSGITPLMSMLKSVLVFEPKSKVSLIYANQNEQSIIFKDQLEKLQAKHGDRLIVKHALAEPLQAITKENWESGMLHGARLREIIGEELPQHATAQTHYYLCGPTGLMEMAEMTYEQMGVPTSNVHKESFYIDKQADEAVAATIESQQVEVQLHGETHQIRVAADKTILDAALDEGLDMPYSCQSGLCTACRGKLTQGKTHMDVDDALSPEELEQGYILTCQAHPLTEDVIVEME